jgi:CBS domain-containing protein
MQIDAMRPVTAARLAVIAADAPLRRAAAALSNSQIELLIVCDASRSVAGVLSKSDIVRHLASVGVAEAPVAALMSRSIVSCGPEDDLYAAWQRMVVRRIQSMPVLDSDGRPLGVLDVRDALKALFEQEEYEERLLSNYVAGIGYQ